MVTEVPTARVCLVHRRKEYHEELIAKKYKYNRPGIEEAFYGTLAFTVNDPFNNKIILTSSCRHQRMKQRRIMLNKDYGV